MAEYTIDQYRAKLEAAENKEDEEAINYFQKKVNDLENTELLFRKKSAAIEQKDEEAIAYFNKRIQNETKFGDTGLSGGDLIFDNLNKYESYNKNLISYYSKEENRPRTGNVDSMYDKSGNWIGSEDDLKALKEKNFEYWNATTLNVLQMGQTALELSKMSDEEKDVAKNLFETYEKTKITGEGSRDGFEQMKDAWHVLYDPTTWMGGKFLMAPAQKAATRKGIMAALTKKTKRVNSDGTERISNISGKKTAIVNNDKQKDIIEEKIKDLPFDRKDSKALKKYAKKTADFTGPRTQDDAAKFIAGQKAIADKSKLSLKKKLLKQGLSLEEANAVVKQAAKSTVRRSAGLGALYTGGYDFGLQTGIQNQLDPNREFNYMQSAASFGLGGAGGAAIPAAGKFAAWALQKPGSMAQNALPKLRDTLSDPLGVIRDPIVRSFGGKTAARVGVAEEAQKAFKNPNSSGSADAAADAFDNLTQAKDEGFQKFKKDYEELGSLESKTDPMGNDVRKQKGWIDSEDAFLTLERPEDTLLTRQLELIKRKLNDPQSDFAAKERIPDLQGILNDVRAGNATPSFALREFRSILSDLSYKANQKRSIDRINLAKANAEIKKLFDASAKRAGKSKQAAKVDEEFSEFAKVTNNPKVQKLTEKVSDTQREIKSAISAGNSSLIKEHINNVKQLAKFSKDPQAVIDKHMDSIRDLTSEVMFTGQTAQTFKRYLSNKDGIKVLKEIYPDLEDEVDALALIQKNSEVGSTIGMFAMRLMTTAVAATYGFGVGGPLGSALSTGLGYVIVEKLLNSAAFRKMAMKTFSKEPSRNPSQLLATTEWFQKRFPQLSPDDVNKVGNIIFGGSLWAYVLSNTDDLNGKIRGGIKFTGDTGKDVIDFLTQESKRSESASNLDDISRKLGVTNLPGFQDNAFSNFQQDPSLITR